MESEQPPSLPGVQFWLPERRCRGSDADSEQQKGNGRAGPGTDRVLLTVEFLQEELLRLSQGLQPSSS